MKIEYTSQQQKVLDARNHNVLVSAAAGSGKTAVLVERIIRMISEGEKPLDIDRLLVVTFTRAAAAEMRERIARAISDRLLEHPDDRHLQKQETLLHHARITTIDSFCTSILKNNFSEIGLDPGFRQMDEMETNLLRADVLHDFLEEKYAEGSGDFLACVDYFCPEERDSELEDLIMRLFTASDSHSSQKGWLLARKKDYRIDSVEELLLTDWYRDAMRRALYAILGAVDTMDGMRKICELPDGPYPYAAGLEKNRKDFLSPFGELDPEEQIRRDILLVEGSKSGEGTGSFEEDAAALEEVRSRIQAALGTKFGMLGRISAKQLVDPDKKDLVSKQWKNLKTMLDKLSEDFFSRDPETALRQMQLAADPMETLIDLTLSYIDAFDEAKRRRGVIDFSDLERMALHILLEEHTDEDGHTLWTPRQAAGMYRTYFDEIMIDEYQDSNEVQELLLTAITGEEQGCYRRFMVGDVKQSIYRFRNARPDIFVRKFETYEADSDVCERIDLDLNFRSRREVLDSVNVLFDKIMHKSVGGVEYDGAASLKCGASYPDPEEGQNTTEILLVTDRAEEDNASGTEKESSGEDAGEPAGEDTSARDEIAELTSRKKEALAIAGRIRSMVGSFPVMDREAGKTRPARYSDIVILVRSSASANEAFREIFEKEGIPLYLNYRTGYFAAEEIRQILQALKVIDNPRQDIALYGFLCGYFGGFDEEEAALIRAGHKEGSFYDALTAAAEGEGSLAVKCRDLLEKLGQWRQKTMIMPVREIVEELIYSTGFADHMRALPGGEQREANLRAFLVHASDFEKTQYTGLFRFLRYIEQMQVREEDYGEAGTLDEKADVVRLMTIHKSKGLEFPICFVSGLAGRFAFYHKDVNARMIVDSDLGIGIDCVDTRLRCRIPTIRKKAVAARIARESLGEELRVLYVAMTRAKEKLILTGYVKDAVRYRKDLPAKAGTGTTGPEGKTILSESVIEAQHCFLDLIEAAVHIMGPEEKKHFRESCIGISDLEVTQAEEQMTMELRKRILTETEGLSGSLLPDPALYEELEKRFSYRYAHEDLEGLYTKTSVSELKMAAIHGLEEKTLSEGEMVLYPDAVPDPYIPSFMRKESGEAGESGEEKPAGLTGTQYGTAVHRAMELMDFAAWKTPSEISEEEFAGWAEKIVESGRFPAEHKTILTPRRFFPFLKSETAARMAKAAGKGKLFREQPFVLGIPAGRLDPAFPNEETILIQGIIDAFFLEEDENGPYIVLLDYKTDRVNTGDELRERYRVQLDYYQEALERILGLPVRDKLLYSFRLEKTIPC